MEHKLIKGAVKFMEQNFSEHKELFESLANKQEPHTLFVGCSDSRVVPNLITQTLPGELFIVRNIAAIVPHYRTSPDYAATTSAIEYALCSLPIDSVVICAHSNCGGCKALYEEDIAQKMPNLAKWLTLSNEVKEVVSQLNITDSAKRGWITERLSVIASYENFFTYPNVAKRVSEGSLQIFAWHYVIETGEIFDYQNGEFVLINAPKLLS